MKHRKFLSPGWLMTLGCGALLAMSTAVAPPEVSAADRVNPRRGKVFYKTNCRTCHDGQTAQVKDLSPITKTMAQWEREFAEAGEVMNCVSHVKEKLGTQLTERDLLDISAYLIQHAADSDQPATCGN